MWQQQRPPHQGHALPAQQTQTPLHVQKELLKSQQQQTLLHDLQRRLMLPDKTTPTATATATATATTTATPSDVAVVAKHMPLPNFMTVVANLTAKIPAKTAHLLGVVDYARVIMSLKSGLLQQTTWALNTMLVMTNEEGVVLPLGVWAMDLVDALTSVFWSATYALNDLPCTPIRERFVLEEPLPRLLPFAQLLERIREDHLLPCSEVPVSPALFHGVRVQYAEQQLTVLVVLRNLALTREHRQRLAAHPLFMSVLVHALTGDLPGCPPHFLWLLRQVALDVLVVFGKLVAPLDVPTFEVLLRAYLDIIAVADEMPEVAPLAQMALECLTTLSFHPGGFFGQCHRDLLHDLAQRLILWLHTVHPRAFVGPVIAAASRSSAQIENALLILFNLAALPTTSCDQSGAMLVMTQPAASVILMRVVSVYHVDIGELALRVLWRASQHPLAAPLIAKHKHMLYEIVPSLPRTTQSDPADVVMRAVRLQTVVRELIDAVENLA